MGKIYLFPVSLLAIAMAFTILPLQTQALVPYSRNPWDLMLPEDPLKILEQTPFPIPKGAESLPLARADWKETATAHEIAIDIPGMKKEDVKIEVEDRVLRVSGERKEEVEVEGDTWHRAERITGKFWRQFRLPANADLDKVKAHLEDGVLRIVIPKLPEEKKTEPKVISIAGEDGSGGDVKTSRCEL